MNVELLSNRLLAALVNGGYQGLLLTGIVWLGLKAVPRPNATTRHAVWFATLLIVALLPVLHFVLPEPPVPGSGSTPAASASTPVRSPAGPAAEVSDAARADMSAAASGTVLISAPLPAEFDAQQAREGLLEFIPWEALLAVANTASTSAGVPESSTETLSLAAESGTGPVAAEGRGWSLSLPGWTGEFLVGIWVLLALIRLGMLGRQCAELNRLKRTAVEAPVESTELFAELGREMGLRRRVRLMLGAVDVAPMAVGFRRPAVLIPRNILQDAAGNQVSQVLRHELAHLVRGDDWANLVQQGIQAILFFHPAVLWISRRMTLEREIACDDHVLAFTSAPRSYALFLTEFAGRTLGRHWAAAPAAWNNTHQLQERIAMILDSKRNTRPRLARASVGVLTLTTAVLATTALLAGPRVALAADQPSADNRNQNSNNASPSNPSNLDVTVDSNDSDAAPSAGLVVSAATPGELPGITLVAPGAAPVPPAAANRSADGSPRPMRTPRATPSGVVVATPQPVMALPASPRTPPAAVVVATPGLPPSPGRVQYALSEEGFPSAEVPPPPIPGPAKRVPRDPNSSIERRLERLEQMMEELVGRDKRGRTELSQDLDHKLHIEFDKDKDKAAKMSEAIAKLTEKARAAGISEADAAKIKEQVRREVEHAMRDAERAVRDAQRAMADGRVPGENLKNAYPERRELEVQIQQLEVQRRGIEKQIQALERQMNRQDKSLDKNREREEREKREGDVSAPGKPKGKDRSNEDDGPKEKVAK